MFARLCVFLILFLGFLRLALCAKGGEIEVFVHMLGALFKQLRILKELFEIVEALRIRCAAADAFIRYDAQRDHVLYVTPSFPKTGWRSNLPRAMNTVVFPKLYR